MMKMLFRLHTDTNYNLGQLFYGITANDDNSCSDFDVEQS